MPSLRLTPRASRLVQTARIAHLATADASGRPHVIPICFVFDGKLFYSPIDEKPKRVAARKLKRVRNIAENPHVALLIDRYDEDWRKLAYALVLGEAKILRRGKTHRNAAKLLRRKYPQYRSMAIDDRPMISITPKRIVAWGKNLGNFSRLLKNP
jgi:PPOX class probable F420-dependent enzyme